LIVPSPESIRSGDFFLVLGVTAAGIGGGAVHPGGAGHSVRPGAARAGSLPDGGAAVGTLAGGGRSPGGRWRGWRLRRGGLPGADAAQPGAVIVIISPGHCLLPDGAGGAGGRVVANTAAGRGITVATGTRSAEDTIGWRRGRLTPAVRAAPRIGLGDAGDVPRRSHRRFELLCMTSVTRTVRRCLNGRTRQRRSWTS
jgi:hypothetical protein